jgi:alcohol dehydrogenase
MNATALVLDEPRSLRRTTYELPEVGDDDGILRIEACGLCGTDHEQYTGHIRAGYGFIAGHEIVGTIESIGRRAAQRWNVSVGDRVAVEVFMSCRECAECRAGRYRRCVEHGTRHMFGFIDVDLEPSLWGGYATHLYLHPDSLVLPVPPSLEPDVATLFNPIGAGIRWGVTVPDLQPGSVVAVLGPGIRGLSVAAAAKEAGAEFVMMTGVSPNDDERLALAPDFGVDLTVDVSTQNCQRLLRDAVGSLADVVVDVTAKAPSALGDAVRLARHGGTIVLAGTRGSADTPGFEPDHLVYKELTVLGSLGVDAPAYRAALDLLASGRYPFADLPRRSAGFEGLEHLILTMAGEAGPPPVHGVFLPDA